MKLLQGVDIVIKQDFSDQSIQLKVPKRVLFFLKVPEGAESSIKNAYKIFELQLLNFFVFLVKLQGFTLQAGV